MPIGVEICKNTLSLENENLEYAYKHIVTLSKTLLTTYFHKSLLTIIWSFAFPDLITNTPPKPTISSGYFSLSTLCIELVKFSSPFLPFTTILMT